MSADFNFFQYAPLVTVTIGAITAIITGAKYFYRRYSNGLDQRISHCIDTSITPIKELANKHEARITGLEDSFKTVIDLFKPRRNNND